MLATLAVAVLACPRTPEPPHGVLLVTIDTVRADHLSAYGYPRATSPELARLAERGARFERAYCTLPGTDASHGSMLTGLHPRSHGMRRNGSRVASERGARSVATHLGEAGYATAAITARVGLDPKRRGIDGFEHTDAPGARNKWRSAEEVIEKAGGWLGEHGGRPWFLWAHFWEPHKPYEPAERWRSEFLDRDEPLRARHTDPPRFTEGDPVSDEDRAVSTALYDAELREADAALGRILALAGSHVPAPDRLLVIVTSDHGEALGDRQALGDGFGHGASLHEEAMRVPWVVAWEGAIPSATIRTPVSLVDLGPTVVELVTGRDTLTAEGRSLARALRRSAEPEAGPVFLERIGSRYTPNDALSTEEYGIIDFPWKLVTDPERLRVRLHDLEVDPGEIHDTSEAEPERTRRLLARLEDFHRDHPMPGEADAPATAADLREREALRALGYMD